jgi:hypothetical protein
MHGFGNGWEHDFARSPRNAGAFAFVELTCAAVGNSLQRFNGVNDLRKICSEVR